MDRDRRVRIYDLHAWSGITLGLFLFVVSWTGSLALFEHELLTWEDPASRLVMPARPSPIHQTLADWVAEQTQGAPAEFLLLSYPDILHPYYEGRVIFNDADDNRVIESQRWNASNGDPLPFRGEGLTTWLLDFHRDLMWPDALGGRTAGRSIVGIAGIIMLLSIISGLVTHRKMMREFFTLRVQRSLRLRWKDAHNVLALWGLPFYAMIAFTGAFLGIIALLLPLTGALIAKGDTDKLLAAIGSEPVEASGVAAQMLSLDDLYQRRLPGSDAVPSLISITNWGDETAVYRINFPEQRRLLITDSELVNGVTGASEVEENTLLEASPAGRATAALAPLHYGTYGGVWLKWLYLLLGLSLCALIVLGLMVWLERRLHGVVGTRSEAFYARIQQIVIGITCGNVLASLAIFYLDKLYTGSEEQRLYWTGVSYFVVWGAVLLFALLRSDPYRAVRRLVLFTGVGLMLLPLLNVLTTGAEVPFVQAPPSVSGWADVSFLLLGLLTCASLVWLPLRRRDPLLAAEEAAPGETFLAG
ncbi:MAG: PepSY-associated TM helix domain-containing protein [Pseudomonadota bacterium]